MGRLDYCTRGLDVFTGTNSPLGFVLKKWFPKSLPNIVEDH